MPFVHISDAIIVSQSSDLVQVATTHLKSKGLAHVLALSGDVEAAKEALGRFPRGFLIIDWDLGPDTVVPILATNQAAPSGAYRAVLLTATYVTSPLIAIAAEYNVSQIYTDEKTSTALGPRLTALLMKMDFTDELHSGLGQAAMLRKKGDLRRSLSVIDDMRTKDPNNLRLKCEAADLRILLDEPEAALQILEGIEETSPPYLRGLHLKGRALMRLRQYDEALISLEKAKLVNPYDTSRLVEIGQAYLHLDRPQDAETNFDAALAIDPTVQEAQHGKGQCRLLEGDINEALELFKDVSGDIEKASLFNTCAVINIRQGRIDDALQLYRMALKAVSRTRHVQARIQFNIGLAQRRLGRKDEAVEALEKSLALDPTFAKARTHIALLSGRSPDKPAAAALGAPKDARKPAKSKSIDDLFMPITADSSNDWESTLEETLEESPFVD